MTNFYDREGKPLRDVIAWAKLYEDNDYRLVERTPCADGTTVSTIWQGFSTLPRLDEPFETFETMVLDNGELTPNRTSTEAEARGVHDGLVKAHGGPREV